MMTSIEQLQSTLLGEFTIIAEGKEVIAIPHDDILFKGDFERDGFDLLLNNKMQPTIRVLSYFEQDVLPNLMGPSGGVLNASAVEKLAGPLAPGEYAQLAANSGVEAIGQVENLSGSASVQRADGSVEILQEGTKVFQNDVVRTDDGGSLSLTFIDGTIFTLSASSRMILDELIYDPNSESNSAAFNLIEGTFVFIAGQVAKTGGMEVTTPAATMGIRGTTVKVDIVTVNGITSVEVSLNRDPDGSVGEFTITRLDGAPIANIDGTETKWVITPDEETTREVFKTAEDISSDQIIITRAVNAFQNAIERVEAGGQFVTQDNTAPQQIPTEDDTQQPSDVETPQDNSDDNNQDDQSAPQEQPSNGETDDNTSDDRAALGSGLETQVASDNTFGSDTSTSLGISDLGSNSDSSDTGTITPLGDESSESTDSSTPTIITTTAPEVNTPPSISLASSTGSVNEDGQTNITGFNISDPQNNILTATLQAGSTVTLTTGSGVTILEGTGVQDERVVIQGTATQINTALNGLIYEPTADADNQGTLAITVSDGEFVVETTILIDIIAQQDPPEANDDAITRDENASLVVGNLLSNDSDPDVTPTPDTLTIQSVSQGATTLTLGAVNTLNGGGSLFIDTDGSYSFDPNGAYDALAQGATDLETLQVVVQDNHGNTDTSNFTITINGIDSPPVIVDENASILETIATLTGNVLSNDYDPEGEALTITSFTHGTNTAAANSTITTDGGGSFTLNANGDYTFNSLGAYAALGDGESTLETILYNLASGQGELAIRITGSNDAPILSVSGTQNYSESSTATVQEVLVASNAAITDVDSDFLSQATISITTGHQAGEDTLAFTDVGGITGSFNPTLGVLTLSGLASVATYQAAIRSVLFSNDSDDISTIQRTISIEVSDGSDTSNIGTTNINVTAINDTPVFVSFSSSFTLNEDTQTLLDLSGVQVSDPDAGNNDISLTISVTNGPGALSFAADSTGNVSISGNELTGTVDQINAYLDSNAVTFTPDQDYENSITTDNLRLAFTVNDQGNSGSGGAQSTTGYADLNVLAVNDEPTISIANTLSGTELITNGGFETGPDTSPFSTLSAGDNSLTGWTIESGNIDHLTNPTNGSAIHSGSFAATFGDNAIDLHGDFKGVISQSITTEIGQIYQFSFELAGHPNNGETIKNVRVTIDGTDFDFSADSTGDTRENPGYETETAYFVATSTSTLITFSSLDAQSTSGPGIDEVSVQALVAGTVDYRTIEDTSTQILGISFEDVDAGSSDVTVTLAVTNGTLSVLDSISSGVVSDQITANGTVSVQLTGTIDEINTTLANTNGLTYLGDLGFNGTDTLSITINDGGATGSGGAQITTTTRDIVVQATASTADINLASTTLAASEDIAVEFGGIDIDSTQSGNITVKLSADKGVINVAEGVVGGLISSQITNNGTYEVTLTGLESEIDATLQATDSIQYLGNLNFNGSDTIEVTVDDNASIVSETIAVTVSAVDDTPPHNVTVHSIVTGGTTLEAVQFTGNDVTGRFAAGLSGIGDINNDGIEDFAISAATSTSEQTGATANTGSVYIIYGQEGENPYSANANSNGEISIDTLVASGAGFELVGLNTDDSAITFLEGDFNTISGAGDFNNDGIDDFVFGVPDSDNPTNSGSAYVVYGGQDFASFTNAATGEISLGTVGTTGGLGGFEARDGVNSGRLGASTAMGGDVDNDGIADLLIGKSPRTGQSSTWLVTGGQDLSGEINSTTGELDLTTLSASIEAYRFMGEQSGDHSGAAVDFLGDFNGDGIDDFIIGAPGFTQSGNEIGYVYVVYGGQDWASLSSGSTNGRDIDLGDVGTTVQGFKVRGPGSGGDNRIGNSVSNAGDVNNDGFADLLFVDDSFNDPGNTYLITGNQTISGTIGAEDIGGGVIDGTIFNATNFRSDSDYATAVGDINGDGFSDILIGGDSNGGSNGGIEGAGYIIYGKDTPFDSTAYTIGNIDGTIGFELRGENVNDRLGGIIRSVGDVNNDGFDDFIISALNNNDGAANVGGSAYLVYGGDYQNDIDLVAGATATIGTSNAETIAGTALDDIIDGGGGADHINAGGGDDKITVEGSTIDYVNGGAGTDTLILSDAGNFDFTNIPDLRLQSIEALDVRNGEANKVSLGISDIFNFSDDANANLESLLSEALPNSFMIEASNADGDSVDLYGALGGGWNLNSTSSNSTNGYNIYEYIEGGSSDVLATLAITDDVTTNIITSS